MFGLTLFLGLSLVAGSVQAQAPGPRAAPAAVPGQAAAQPAQAQQAQGGKPGEWFWRFGFLTLDQCAFTTHPYAQITGASPFNNGKAAAGGTFSTGAASSDSNSDFLVQLLHALPPFFVEAGQPVDLFLPKGFTVGLDYYEFSQDGSSAGNGGTVPPIKTDTYLYQVSVRGFAFDPTQPGINYYAGIGVGTLMGKLTAQPFVGQPSQVINFGQNLTGSVLLGLEAKGDNLGLRYELNLLNASQVKLDKNPYPNSTQTTINFSGTITRFAIFYQF
jgi:hypothetical protein